MKNRVVNILNSKDIGSSGAEEMSESINNRISLKNKKHSTPSLLEKVILKQGTQGKEKR